MSNFSHLHTHTEYSTLDGAIRLEELIKLTKKLEMKAMSITDHGSLGGCLTFYREAIKAGIKPILGIETYLTENEDNCPKDERTKDNYHMILLASNQEGWENLLYLSSNAYRNNFYYKPRISLTQLANHSRGIIGNSACLAGLCARHATYDEMNKVYSDPEHKVERLIARFKEMFFGNYYLELMDSSQDIQIAYNKFLIEMSAKTDTKLILTADAHYLERQDEELHDMLMAMQTKRNITEYKQQDYFRYENCYIRPPAEMLDAAIKIGAESAWHNTQEIADKIDLNIKLGEYKMPVFDISTDKEYSAYCEENP